jgi:hypothetical protein
MKIPINEELNYMKYLFGYQKGRVISEQYKPQLNPDGCENGYYKDCTTKLCTPIPKNTKIVYSQEELEITNEAYSKIPIYNKEYESSFKKGYDAYVLNQNFCYTKFSKKPYVVPYKYSDGYCNFYLLQTDNGENRSSEDFPNKPPVKYYTYNSSEDYKDKITNGGYKWCPGADKGTFPKSWFRWKGCYEYLWPRQVVNVGEIKNKSMSINDLGGTIGVGSPTSNQEISSLKEILANSSPFENLDTNNLLKWEQSSEGKLLIPLMNKLVAHQIWNMHNSKGNGYFVSFKSLPNVLLSCIEPIKSEPIKPPEPIEDPKPIEIEDPKPIEDPEPTVNPNYPEYSLQYKKKKYLDVKLPKNKLKSVFDRGVLNTPGRFKISEKDPKEIARYVKYYEGYDDDEGNHIPGEIEKAQQQNRQIKFLEPVSDEDELAQQRYKEEYAEYKKTYK